MRRTHLSCSMFAALCIVAAPAQALTRSIDDMCTAPKMKTDKWQSSQEAGGMTILLPPGFVARGGTGNDHFYVNGEHRSLAVGLGRGDNFQSYPDVSETGECEAVIAGRRVTMTMYHWVVEDAALSASGNAGPHFAAVARFYATGTLREVYVELMSNAPSDLKYFRQLFWTVSFPGSPAPAAPATVATFASATPPAAAEPPAPAAVASPPACDPAALAGLPAPDAVLDSSVVRMLIASATPIPKGYELMALQFAGSGELSGMSVAQSDLPEASQHELSSVIATNLKPHDAHAPSTFLLRIDSSDTGLRYAVLPISGCTH
jgi:hypothetical protein